MNRILIILLIIVVLYSCQSNIHKNIENKKVNIKELVNSYLIDSNKLKLGASIKFILDTFYYSYGVIDSIKTRIDTSANGYMINFYENGNIKWIKFYRHSLLNGEQKSYYKGGIMDYCGFWKNGMRDSIERFFYQSGSLQALYSVRRNQAIGGQFFYKENGGLDSYIFCNDKGENRFKSTYDSIGNIIKEDGNPIVDYGFYSHYTHYFNVGDTAFILIFCAKPPHANFSLVMKEKNNLYGERDLSLQTIDKGAFIEPYILSKSGDYNIIATCTLIDSITNKKTEYIKELHFKVK